jgi:hypothetical protein
MSLTRSCLKVQFVSGVGRDENRRGSSDALAPSGLHKVPTYTPKKAHSTESP